MATKKIPMIARIDRIMQTPAVRALPIPQRVALFGTAEQARTLKDFTPEQRRVIKAAEAQKK